MQGYPELQNRSMAMSALWMSVVVVLCISASQEVSVCVHTHELNEGIYFIMYN